MVKIHEHRGVFGVAEVVGLEPGAGDEDAAALRAALARHAVLCLRMDAPLEDAELQSVARFFGPIKDPVGGAKDGSPFRYEQPRQIIDSGFVMTDEIRQKLASVTPMWR